MDRRTVLKAMGLVPRAARSASESVVKQQMGLGSAGALNAAYGATAQGISKNSMPRDIAAALLSPEKRAAIQSVLFEEHRAITALDFDLANSKALSLAAKITYQRQRNVERKLQEMSVEFWWDRTGTAISKIVTGA